MTVLEARGVAVGWSAAIPILTDVSFVLTPGFYGLVGANGAGKTTLLRVLAGEIVPSEGAVELRPAAARVVHCPQRVDEPGADVMELASSHDGAAAELKGRLALDSRALERWSTLSPGERKRWQVGAALVREPDVLLLDEPTNHLDACARGRLVSALQRFRGIGVIVSHDRSLLDTLPSGILRVHEGTVTSYSGSWSQAHATWTSRRQEQELARAEAKAAVRAVERRLDAARRDLRSADASRSAGARMKNKRDHNARSMGRKVVAGWAEARAGRSVEVVRRELARAEAEVPSLSRDPTLGGRIFASYERCPHAVLFHLDRDELRAGEALILREVRVDVARDARIRIAGANGAGKTTLLSALVASRPIHDRILFVPQELTDADVASFLSRLAACSDVERGRILSVFSALGSDPARILGRAAADARTLSPGEARKLALATGLGRHAWALVLDEPTNHLDLPTIERLERALADYPGCIAVVTHDDAFARAVTTRTLRVAGGKVS